VVPTFRFSDRQASQGSDQRKNLEPNVSLRSILAIALRRAPFRSRNRAVRSRNTDPPSPLRFAGTARAPPASSRLPSSTKARRPTEMDSLQFGSRTRSPRGSAVSHPLRMGARQPTHTPNRQPAAQHRAVNDLIRAPRLPDLVVACLRPLPRGPHRSGAHHVHVDVHRAARQVLLRVRCRGAVTVSPEGTPHRSRYARPSACTVLGGTALFPVPWPRRCRRQQHRLQRRCGIRTSTDLRQAHRDPTSCLRR
jgi:hypothetical protein